MLQYNKYYICDVRRCPISKMFYVRRERDRCRRYRFSRLSDDFVKGGIQVRASQQQQLRGRSLARFRPEADRGVLRAHRERWKRMVTQARHDGGRFNLACTWLESAASARQPVPRFRDSHEGRDTRRKSPEPRQCAVLNKFQFNRGERGGTGVVGYVSPSVAINELLIPPFVQDHGSPCSRFVTINPLCTPGTPFPAHLRPIWTLRKCSLGSPRGSRNIVHVMTAINDESSKGLEMVRSFRYHCKVLAMGKFRCWGSWSDHKIRM